MAFPQHNSLKKEKKKILLNCRGILTFCHEYTRIQVCTISITIAYDDFCFVWTTGHGLETQARLSLQNRIELQGNKSFFVIYFKISRASLENFLILGRIHKKVPI